MLDDAECKLLLDEYIQFFNTNITDIIYKHFESDEVQKKIYNYEPKIKSKYLAQHFIKTYNLLIAIIVLAYGNNIRQLPDEAKIIFRSLFENILNFIYIFSYNNEKEQVKLIKQFYAYTEVAFSKYQRNLLKEEQQCTNKTKEHTLVINLLQKLNIKEKLLSLEKEYKNNYTNKMSHWSGKSTKCLIDYIRKNKPELGFDFYQKYYYDTNIFVHCNVLEYLDINGAIIENRDEYDILDLIHKSIFMFYGYAEWYFNLIDKSFNNTNVYKVLEPIIDKYHNFHKKQPSKDIYI